MDHSFGRIKIGASVIGLSFRQPSLLGYIMSRKGQNFRSLLFGATASLHPWWAIGISVVADLCGGEAHYLSLEDLPGLTGMEWRPYCHLYKLPAGNFRL